MKIKRILSRALVFGLLVASSTTYASVIKFDIEGLDSLGSGTALVIDFIDGDGASSSVWVNGIATDGTTGLGEAIGSVTPLADGYLLDDSNFYSSLALTLTGASQLSLYLNTTHYPPAPGLFADVLALYLVDFATGIPSLFTDEPLGANALISWTPTGVGNGDLSVYGPTSTGPISWTAVFVNATGPTNSIPEPSPLLLLGAGIMAGLAVRHSLKEKQA
ncbi:hypothetical protein AGMMS49960_16220 [Betaproteobacteria bacterium]|nr:hypothetical protein AGMMS49543_20340 [Betaproteobacteria bacterium]GHU02884.1 hypothetical protein AGMMS49960_16220 [Betaproteobacteria bacterium]GHU20195.1 hypothetical protein AGMMS50243_14120 [Betaproteobacteria bacterium]